MDKLSKEISLGPGVTTIIIITLFLLVVGIGIIMLVLLYQKRQLQYLKDKEQLKGDYEKEILGSKLEIQEQTMKNISQEIHDNIGQVLSLVKLNLNSINSADVALQKKVISSNELVSKVIQDLRELARSLHTDTVMEMGLLKSIERELDLVKKAGNYQTFISEEGDSYSLPQQHELILFRIFQEAINNIIKHAKASAITVEIFYALNTFIMQIKDDGEGFDPAVSSLNKPSGLGIQNIQNRSRIIGAEYKIDSNRGKGTTVKISLPHIKEHDAELQ